MRRFIGAMVAVVIVSGPVLADDPKAMAILDKAIKAIGGEDKLSKVSAYSWTSTPKVIVNDEARQYKMVHRWTVKGLDQIRCEHDGEIEGKIIRGVNVLNGDKGWVKAHDQPVSPYSEQVLGPFKRGCRVVVIPFTLAPLKGPDFKLEAAGEEMVEGKPALALKVTGPNDKDFILWFDKENGLPVMMRTTAINYSGDENPQETTFGDYKEFGGLKRATKAVTKTVNKGGARTVLEEEITEFKALDKVGDDAFAEPQ